MVPELSEREQAESNTDARRHRAEMERRERMARDGDVDGLWEILTRPRPAAFDAGEIFPLLFKAIVARSRRSPAEFSGEILARVVALNSYLTLRGHYLVTTELARYGRSAQGVGRIELPKTLAERVLPDLQALQASLGEVLHAQAAVARLWELQRARRIENDRAEKEPPAKAIPKGKAQAGRDRKSPPAQGSGKPHGYGKHNKNGKPGVNRIAGLPGGRGPKAGGVRNDD